MDRKPDGQMVFCVLQLYLFHVCGVGDASLSRYQQRALCISTDACTRKTIDNHIRTHNINC